MLSLNQIKQQYPPALQNRARFLLREYLQYKMLEILSQLEEGNQLVFMGGTAIRLVYNSQRFSEDLDFDNQGLSQSQFKHLCLDIQRQLKLQGIEVETRFSFKQAAHCYFKFLQLLQQFGLTKQKKEKILIRFDATSQEYRYQPDFKMLNKFDFFAELKVAPLALLLSQKIMAALKRKRAKGRDFYDIVFLQAQTEPDFNYLKHKLEIDDKQELKQRLLARCKQLDMNQLSQDVAPFLMNQANRNRVEKFVQFVEGWL